MLAVLGRSNDTLLMKFVRRGDDDGIEIAKPQHGFEIVEWLSTEILGDRLGPCQIGVEDGHQHGAVARLDRRCMAQAHDGAGTDQADLGLGYWHVVSSMRWTVPARRRAGS